MEELSKERLIESLETAQRIAGKVVEERSKLDSGASTRDFAESVAALQKECVPLIMLIAETRPPVALKAFAMKLAIGIKATELGLWYYLDALMGGDTAGISAGDSLVREGSRRINEAAAMVSA